MGKLFRNRRHPRRSRGDTDSRAGLPGGPGHHHRSDKAEGQRSHHHHRQGHPHFLGYAGVGAHGRHLLLWAAALCPLAPSPPRRWHFSRCRRRRMPALSFPRPTTPLSTTASRSSALRATSSPTRWRQRWRTSFFPRSRCPSRLTSQIGMRLHGMRQMKSDYIDHLLSTVDCDMRGLRVLVDCANGAASATAPGLFGKLPLHADFIFDKPDGININKGCGSTHMETLCRGVVAGKVRLGHRL